MTNAITVVIPVGPHAQHTTHLRECLESVKAQTMPCDVILVDDMHGLQPDDVGPLRGITEINTRVWYSPWRLGVAHAFNFGVAIANTELVFMLGADDALEPDCLAQCMEEYARQGYADGYYWVGVRYLDVRIDNIQHLPCGAAMVTKKLWRVTGGFAPETASGASDAAFISMMMVHSPERLFEVAPLRTLYNYRPGPQTDTSERGRWQGVILETRSILTQNFEVTRWGRYDE